MSSLPRIPPRTWDSEAPNRREALGENETLPPPPSYGDSKKEKSLDITQKLERKLAQLNASENAFKRWFFELVSWAVSAICMGAIIGILLYLNNKSLTKWPLGLTINTVLSKVASAALILPTSEALGQLKWNWFHGKDSKEMWDFEIFDKASRGAWGSVLLLFRTKGRSLAALGAILTLLLIANDTFFQQVVDLPERWNIEGNSSIAKVVWYEPETTVEIRGGVPMVQQDTTLWTVVQNFLYGNGSRPVPFGNGTGPEIPVSCPTSNCTWPTYETLGVCSRCADISPLLTFTCRTTTTDWIGNLTGLPDRANYPNGTMCGYFINATSELPVLMTGYSTTAVESSAGAGQAGEALLMRTMSLMNTHLPELAFDGSIHFSHIRSPLIDVLIVAAPNGSASVYRNETPVAQECVLSWCVKQIKSSYYWGTYQEEVIDTLINTTGRYRWKYERLDSAAVNGSLIYYTENVTIHSATEHENSQPNSVYGTLNDTQLNAMAVFDYAFPSFLTADDLTSKPSFRYRASFKGLPRTRNIKFNPWIPPNNVTRHMERLSTALTNMLRSSESADMITGTAYSVETYVRVQWAWLIFPFALLTLSLVFLVATMIKTRGAAGENPGVWKTSAMPTLIYSLPKDMQRQLSSSSTTFSGTSSGGAKNLRIRLHPKRGWRVSGHPCSPDSPILRSNQAPPGWI